MAMPRLKWREIALTTAYHAALVSSRFHPRSDPHTHDFCEILYVVAGRGMHQVNGQTLALQAGDLNFVREDDCHAITARDGTDLQFVNVAFLRDPWEAFCALADVPHEAWYDNFVRPAAEQLGVPSFRPEFHELHNLVTP